MAKDVITRFKLETTQYDSALRNETSRLKDFSKTAALAGKDFDKFTKSNVEAARALGTAATGATNAKDKVKELVSSYNSLANTYNSLSAIQKQSDFAKAMAESLTTLQGRIKDAKQELYNAGDGVNSFGGMLDQLAQKFTINIDALKLFNMGMQAAGAALDVAKDAFFANEQQLDAWGATVESAESLYQGFLNSLNNGDISGYLNSINEIVRAANSAYNALDALGTFNAFNQVNVEKTRTNMTESIVDYREGKADKNAVRAAGDAYKKELEERRRLEQEAYIEAIGKVAAERGVNKQDLIDALSGSYGHYQDLKNIQPTGTVTKYSPGIMPGSQGSYTTYTVAQNRQEKLGEALRQLNDTELQSLQALGAQAQRTGNEIAQVDRQLVRVLNSRQGGGSGGGGITTPRTTTTKVKGGTEPYTGSIVLDIPEGTTESMKQLSEQLRYFNELRQNATTTGDYLAATEGIEHTKQQMGVQGDALAMGVSTDAMIAMQESLKESMAESFASAFKGFQTNAEDVAGMNEGDDKSWEKFQKSIGNLSTAMSGLTTVTSGLQALGIKIDGDFANFLTGLQGAISVVQGVISIINALSVPSEAANTIATHANTAALASMTAALHSNTFSRWLKPFAAGGIVPHAANGFLIPGNDYSDRTPVLAQSGELILNKAQQGNLLAQMQGDGMMNMHIEGIIAGEDIRLVLKNGALRRNESEYLNFNFS